MSAMTSVDSSRFLSPGVPIRFAERDDLLAKLDELDAEVPARNEGRRTEHREHYAIVRFLRFLAGERDLLPLPVTLRMAAKGQDPPDFTLEWPGGRRETIEHTDGSTKEYQQRLSEAARTGEQGLILPVDINTPRREAAVMWADILFRSFLAKAEDLRRGGFSIDHLLIYDLTGLNLLLPLETGAPLLRNRIEGWLRREQPAHRFARVSILRDLALLFDLLGEARLLRGQSPYFRLGDIRARDEDDLRRRLRELDRYCREHSIRHLKLFGSVLKDIAEDEWEVEDTGDGFGPDSDLDLLVEFEPGTQVTLFDMARMERELGELIGMTVDLRTAGDLSRYFRQKVLSEAVDLHAQ